MGTGDDRAWHKDMARQVSGPVLTLVIALAVHHLRDTAFYLSNPPALFILAIVYSAFRNGLPAGLASAAIAWSYVAYYFSQPDAPFQYTDANLRRVWVWGVTMPVTAYMVGSLKQRALAALTAASVASIRNELLEERERDSASIREKERQLQNLIDKFPDFLMRFDRDSRFTYINPATERILGMTQDEVQGKTVFDLPVQEARHQFADIQARIESVIQEKRIQTFEVVWPSRDEMRTFAVRYFPEVDATGNVFSVLCIAQDITAEKRIEQENQSQLLYFARMDQINQAIQGAGTLESLIATMLETARATLPCDGVRLAGPNLSSSTDLRVYGAGGPGDNIPPAHTITLNHTDLHDIRQVCDVPGPVYIGPNQLSTLPLHFQSVLDSPSNLLLMITPSTGAPWYFILHSGTADFRWAREDLRLYQEFGRRLTDALGNHLADRVLRESERKLAAAERIAHVGYWERTSIPERVSWSDEMYRIFGLEPQAFEVTINQFRKLIHPADWRRLAHTILAASRTDSQFTSDFRIVRPNNEVRYVLCHGEVTSHEAGGVFHMFGTMQDVTERRKAEDEVRRSEARFRTFVDHATDSFLLHDSHGHILDANRQACQSLGYEAEEMASLRLSDIDSKVSGEFLRELKAKLDSDEVLTFESRHRRKDGSEFPVEVRLRAFTEHGQRYAVSLSRDISERKRVERQLIESHTLLNAVVEGTPDAIFVKDLAGRYLMINSTGARYLGRPVKEITGKTDLQLFTPDTADNVMRSDRQVIQSGTSEVFEETATAAGISRTYLATKSLYRDALGEPIGIIGISRDITAIKALEAQLRQAQKMEAIGRLAGGIAHDFNNILTIITGNCELVFRSLAADEPNRDLMAEIQQAGERAALLTRQLLAFSRKQVLQPQVVDLNELLADLIRLIHRLIGEDVEVDFQPAASLSTAKIDPGQFEQAIINLAVNARDAMPKGGKLIIRTGEATLTNESQSQDSEVRPGRYVVVSVIDSGHGMTKETQAGIFEPFFTTKEAGRGTGLGLAMTYGFVKQSGGQIEVESAEGEGATFRIYLPATGKPSESTRAQPHRLPIPRGSETVLLVEDEDMVRRLAKRILESNGYVVLAAPDGQDALALADGYAEPIDILVSDLVMPRMSGIELAEALTRARPSLRVLLMSGYTDSLDIEHGLEREDTHYIQKPFSATEFAQRVRSILDQESS